MADDLPDAPWADGGSDLPDAPWKSPAHPSTGMGKAALQGALNGETAGWYPEIEAAGKASGIPDWASSGPGGAPGYMARSMIGAGRLAYEHLTGQRGPATEEYERTKQVITSRNQQLQKEHPYVYGGSELAGSIIPMAIAPEAEGAGLVARTLQGAKIGAGYGAASGAAEGTEKNGAVGALQGAGIGALQGAVGGAGGELGGSLLGKGLGAAYDYLGRPLASTVRGWASPEGEAARRVAGALFKDYPQVSLGQTPGMTPIQWAAAKAAGEPVIVGDLGGETTRALLRSSANSSPEGRAVIDKVIHDRFAQQNDRAGMTVRGLVSGGANSLKTRAQLEAEYDAERGAAYSSAYEAGDRPIWSPELERLTSAPAVADAIRGAVNKWRDWQVLDGFGVMNPPVKVTPDGQIKFGQGRGLLPSPTLQLWDYASRNLAGAASAAARAGNDQEAARLGGLERALKAELDKQVPEFANARGIAARYFGGNNVIEAGEKAINFKGNPLELKQTMAKMQRAEREMFQESYADALARKLESTSDRQDILARFFNSPQERNKIGVVFGKDGVDRLQAFVNRESIFDAARKALGGSTTARQLIEAGLAGGAAGGILSGGDYRSILEGGIGAATARKIAPEALMTGVRTAAGYIDRNTATRVAKLLTSNDPRELMKGLQIAAKNKRIGDRLNEIAIRASASLGASGGPRIPLVQLPKATSAQDQQQNVPGIPPQRKAGGRVNEEQPSSVHQFKVSPEKIGARLARNGHWYVEDRKRPGKFMVVLPRAKRYRDAPV